jgi:hypothetical protein
MLQLSSILLNLSQHHWKSVSDLLIISNILLTMLQILQYQASRMELITNKFNANSLVFVRMEFQEPPVFGKDIFYSIVIQVEAIRKYKYLQTPCRTIVTTQQNLILLVQVGHTTTTNLQCYSTCK